MEQTVTVKEAVEGSKTKPQNISVFGLGKVGLTFVSCLSNNGNQVIGVDVSPDLVSAVNDGSIQSAEPGVNQRLANSLDNLFATTDPVEAIQNSDISFIIVPTPSNTLGGFSLRYVLESCRSIGKALRTKSGKHIVSLVSTVLPGSSDHFIIPELEKTSGRKIGKELGYCYNPSFIALGEIVKGLEVPDYILLGETDTKTGDRVLEAHRSMLEKEVPIARMHPIEAEITKLASNTHETMRVSFANMLLAACEEIPGANVDRVTGALSHRMGKRFFKGAIPFGGPCWPRDNKALSVFLELVGVPSCMPRNVDLFNEEHGYYILRKILEFSTPEERIGIIGLAYKPGTYVIERSYPIDLIGWLSDENREVVGWDPQAMEETKRALGDKIDYAKSGDTCFEESSVIIIAQPLKELEDFDWTLCKDKVVIDCWRCLTPVQIAQISRYIPLGEGVKQRSWMTLSMKKRLDILIR